jgi:hypothetical protein
MARCQICALGSPRHRNESARSGLNPVPFRSCVVSWNLGFDRPVVLPSRQEAAERRGPLMHAKSAFIRPGTALSQPESPIHRRKFIGVRGVGHE